MASLSAADEPPPSMAAMRQTFSSGKTRSLAWRMQQLKAARDMLKRHRDEWVRAVVEDTLKPVRSCVAAQQDSPPRAHVEKAKARHHTCRPADLASQSRAELAQRLRIARRLLAAFTLAPWILPGPLDLTVRLHLVLVNASECEAVVSDFTTAETDIESLISNLARWARPRAVPTPLSLLPASSRVERQPFGVTL
eukprot:6210083-Pleurochrysis_carterae.AAC.1